MKCINGSYRCSRIGFSGGKECCGYLLAVGETKFIYNGFINDQCPLPQDKIGAGEHISQQPYAVKGETPTLPEATSA